MLTHEESTHVENKVCVCFRQSHISSDRLECFNPVTVRFLLGSSELSLRIFLLRVAPRVLFNLCQRDCFHFLLRRELNRRESQSASVVIRYSIKTVERTLINSMIFYFLAQKVKETNDCDSDQSRDVFESSVSRKKNADSTSYD